MLNVEITMENYGKILKHLQPKLKKYIAIWAYEFKIDANDVEDIVYKSLEETINRFDKKKGNCKFISYFITFTRNRIINEVRDTEKEKYFLMSFRSNPCEICNNSYACSEKCFKYKMHYRGCLSLNAEENRQARDFTEELANQEHKKAIIKTFLKRKPKYRRLIENIMEEIQDGYTGRHALARGIKRTITGADGIRYGSRYGIYKQITYIQKYLRKIDNKLLMKGAI